MLKSIPVAADRIRFISIDHLEVASYNDDGTRSDQPRTDADGRIFYRLNCLALVDGQAGGETVAIRVAMDTEPSIPPLSPVRFTDLVARPWEQNGRSGVSLIATGVEVEGGTTNGRKKDPFTPAQEVAV
jgi:hypothetical protein